MTFQYDLARFIPFRDAEACARVRAIKFEDITKHPNPDFKISVIKDRSEFYGAFASDIVSRIKDAHDHGRQYVGIFPVGPMPQYAIAARMINEMKIPLHHVHTFNMDEYADMDGNTAPLDWPGSFQQAMWNNFFGKIDPSLRPPENQIHFPTKKDLPDYGKRIADLGGADACYGGIGWCGHVAFWEAHLGDEFGDDLESYKKAGPRLVELHPMTIMQNALHSFGSDWSWVPPKANTIGPAEILGSKHRSFWLDGDLGGGIAWQRFIGKLCAHGPISTYVPGSILQLARTDYVFLEGVAADVEITMS